MEISNALIILVYQARPPVVDMRRPRRRGLDRKHEYCIRRQQNVMFIQL